MKYSNDSFCIQPLVDEENLARWNQIMPVQPVSTFVHDPPYDEDFIITEASKQFPII